jgi:ferredoxin
VADKTVTITVDDKPVDATMGTSLLNVVVNADVLIDTACGGSGKCHLCRIQIIRAPQQFPQANEVERHALGNVLLSKGVRLACQTNAVADLSFNIIRRPPKGDKSKRS